jgi:hypothetical protein
MLMTVRKTEEKMPLLAQSPAAPRTRPYNMGETAAICQSTPYKIRIAIAEGRLKAVKRHGTYEIEPDDLAEYITSHVNKVIELP